MNRVRLSSHGSDYPCFYSLYINNQAVGYIIPTLYGFEAKFDSGMVLFAQSFSTLLRMVVSYG